MRCRALVPLIALVALAIPGAADASWTKQSTGAAYSQAKSLQSGNTPTASVSGRTVTVAWSASTLTGGGAIDGYQVKRYNTSGTVQAIGAACSGTIAALTCTERAVPSGSWKYSVTPVLANWRGAESAQSPIATVGSPGLTLNSPSTTTLPATFSGQIANYVDGQSVTFRLDHPSTGTVLSGSITPTSVPASGTVAVSVTVPAGTQNGSHTVYAIGNQGDVAGASVNVNIPTTTIATTAWSVGDASSGTESVQSAGDAFANDGRTYTSGKFGAFSTSRYIETQMNAPLAGGGTVSAASFTFRFAPANPNDTGCFYFDVRRISTNAVIGTHGSAAAPLACPNTTTQVTTTTSIPEVTTTTIANDLAIRVYASNDGGGGKPIVVDQATVAATVSGQSYTLYDQRLIDAATGSGSTTVPWGLAAAGDNAFYQSVSAWTAAFTTTRYLKLTFPAYVPTGATLSSASFKHAYRSAAASATCWYFEVYSGATLLGTHGTAASPVSCNSSTTAYVADTVALPEVNTAAKANSLNVKLYLRSSAAAASQHDLAQLSVGYSN